MQELNGHMLLFIKLLLFSILAINPSSLSSQSDYSILFTQNQELLSFGKLDIDKDDQTMIFAPIQQSNILKFIKYDEGISFHNSFDVKLPDQFIFSGADWFFNEYSLAKDNAFALTTTGPNRFLIGLNVDTDLVWSKLIAGSSTGGHLVYDTESDRLFVSYGAQNLNLRILSAEGQEILHSAFELKIANDEVRWVEAVKLETLESELYIAAVFRDKSSNKPYAGLLKCNKDGEVLDQVFFKNLYCNDLHINESDGSFYLSMHTFDANNNFEDGQIIHLDSSFNIRWSKKVHAENFTSLELKVVKQNDNIILAYSTWGSFPVIFGKLDLNGNLIYQTGLSHYMPDLDTDSKGNLYVTTGFEFQPDGSGEAKLVVSKFSDIEQIDNCPEFNSCLVVIDTTYEMIDVQFESITLDTLSNVPVELEESEVQLENYCQVLPPPEAIFEIPNTICLLDSLSPSNLKSALANYVSWELIAPDGQIIKSEKLEPLFFFDKKGTYRISQTIWYLGCSEHHEVEILVSDLDSINYVIEDPCLESTPIIITINDPNNSFTYNWNSGETTNYIAAESNGSYSVVVSNNFCEDTLFFDIEKSNFDINDVISFVPSATICISELPYELSPVSNFENKFSIENSPEEFQTLLLNEFGAFTIYTKIDDCTFQRDFELIEKDCILKIYIPSAFSPNGDGINDEFTVYLENQEFVSLEIFSRWGNKVFKSRNLNNQWDGKLKGEYLNPDLFMYVLRIRSDDQIEVLSGDFVLLR